MTRTSEKRPFALTSALLLCLFFGFWGANDGCQTMAYYRNGSVDPPMEVLAIGDASERENVSQAFTYLAEETEAARPRAFPLAAASLVLGVAVVLFTLRAFARTQGSRAMLWQLALAQTALVVAGYFGLPRLTAAKKGAMAAMQRAQEVELEHSEDPQRDSAKFILRVLPALPAASIAIRTVLGVLIVLVLTKRSTREYFDPPMSSEQG